jgi:prepilin-type N-terminal cleavage/methylation domain-containing protein
MLRWLLLQFKYGNSKFKHGFTLIEVIVAIGLLTLILGAAYSMQLFGNKSYNRSAEKSEIQDNLRLASDFITKEIRYSSEVSILASIPATKDTTKKYISKVGSNIEYQYYSSGWLHRDLVIGTSAISYSLSFEAMDSQKTLQFLISGASSHNNYSLKTLVKPLNMDTQIAGTAGDPVICYK